jgi:hypothetical protein
MRCGDRLDELLTAYDQARAEAQASGEARRQAEETLQAFQDNEVARRMRGLVARLRMAWRGDTGRIRGRDHHMRR